MKLQLMNGKQFFLTLPNSIVKAKGWKKGDNIKVYLDKCGNIKLITEPEFNIAMEEYNKIKEMRKTYEN